MVLGYHDMKRITVFVLVSDSLKSVVIGLRDQDETTRSDFCAEMLEYCEDKNEFREPLYFQQWTDWKMKW